jgi:hypothetical protein
MGMTQWFLCDNDIVAGPFTADAIIQKVVDGTVPSNILIWGKALHVWKPYQWWHDNLTQIIEDSKRAQDPRLWHFAYRGESVGPLERSELVSRLQGFKGDANEALIWTQGMSQWSPIFEFHDIMDEVGVNRRHFPRAPISGKIVLQQDGQYIVGELKAVSEGGFGAHNFAYDLAPGLILKCELVTVHLGGKIFVTGQVRYLDAETVGFKFVNINRESQSLIVSYVKEKNFEMIAKMQQAS